MVILRIVRVGHTGLRDGRYSDAAYVLAVVVPQASGSTNVYC